MALTVFDVANYFLSGNYENTNLHLQKLVYCAQGFSLVTLDRPLFSEVIEAWQYGPVVPELFMKYREYGYRVLPAPKKFNLDNFSDEEKVLLNELYYAYCGFDDWRLQELMESNYPWKEAFERGDSEISLESMKEFFATQVELNGGLF